MLFPIIMIVLMIILVSSIAIALLIAKLMQITDPQDSGPYASAQSDCQTAYGYRDREDDLYTRGC